MDRFVDSVALGIPLLLEVPGEKGTTSGLFLAEVSCGDVAVSGAICFLLGISGGEEKYTPQ